jgi:hypothetical protein
VGHLADLFSVDTVEFFFPGVKRPVLEAGHSPASGNEIQSASTLIKHGDDITFTQPYWVSVILPPFVSVFNLPGKVREEGQFDSGERTTSGFTSDLCLFRILTATPTALTERCSWPSTVP